MRHRSLRAAAVVSAALLMAGLSAVAQPVDNPIQLKDFLKFPGQVQDLRRHVSFDLPEGWALVKGNRWGDNETTLQLQCFDSSFVVSMYYQYPLRQRYKDARTALNQALENKMKDRRRAGLKDYYVPANSIQSSTIGGNPALSFCGESTSEGLRQVEYITQPSTGDREPADRVAEARKRIQSIHFWRLALKRWSLPGQLWIDLIHAGPVEFRKSTDVPARAVGLRSRPGCDR